MKRLLMVAFEFPPSNGASTQRILSVYHHYVQQGWAVDVLTVDPRAYANVSAGLEPDMDENPAGHILRPRAWDVQRDLAYKGKYFGWMMTPDRWGMTWVPNALMAIRKHVKQHRPDVIWSSAPIPSTHLLASRVAKLTGAPWIADYRDPMPYLHRPASDWLNRVHRRIDLTVMRDADALTFATKGTRDIYIEAFNALPVADKSRVMENGFSEGNFVRALTEENAGATPFSDDVFSFYYAGVLYADGRDPAPIFEALSAYREQCPRVRFEFIFQGAGDGAQYAPLLATLGLADVVKFLPGTHFMGALNNMLHADALVLIQDEKFNSQVPGKIYEYLRTGRSILLKTPSVSATAKVGLSHEGVYQCYEKHCILSALHDIFAENNRSWQRDVSHHTREYQIQQLDNIVAGLLAG
jgi:hypothetical protein